VRWKDVAIGLGLALVACDDGPPPGPPVPAPPEWNEARTREAASLETLLAGSTEPADGALTIRLAFGAEADLDLYVTGPFDEAVYYANTPSAIGGALLADRRCVHDAPRVETIRFAPPITPGRYRVGIDYPHACTDTGAPAPFAVAIEGPATSARLRGLARHRVFEPIVTEVVVDAPAPGEGVVRGAGEREGGMDR